MSDDDQLTDDDLSIAEDPDGDRYTISVRGEVVGLAAYRDREGVRVFTHTEVNDAYEGQGLASRLVAFAVADVEDRGLTMAPRCPYVRSWLERHPGHEAVVADG